MDGVLTRSSFYIPYIFGEMKYIVEGTVLVDPALAGRATTAAVHPAKPHSIVICDKTGAVVSSRAVSKDEYQKFKKDNHLLASR